MNGIEYVLGEACKILLPIPEEVYRGSDGSPVAVCTLSSISLLKEIASSETLGRVAIAGRLLSENRGIDAMIRFVVSSPNVRTVVVCGREVRGHRAGHSLLALYRNGADGAGRIVGSSSPDPVLQTPHAEIERFRRQVTIVDRIGQTDRAEIDRLVRSMTQ